MIKIFALTLLLIGLATPWLAAAQTGVPMPVTTIPYGGTTVNTTVVIAGGNTFQTILAANASRRAITVENNNTGGTDLCWIFVGSGTPTKATSFSLAVGAQYNRAAGSTPPDQIQATCATTSDTLYVDFQ